MRHELKTSPAASRIQAFGMLTTLLGVFFLSFSATGAEVGKGLGDGNDGNRSGPIHLITLYDDKGLAIKATDQQPRPVSMKNTCGECHNYETISKGWHFHSGSERPPSGRVGEPWVLTDSWTRSQIPVSNRDWKGAQKPSDLQMSPWQFMSQFGSHMPGGNYGEMEPGEDDETVDPAEFLRWPISGHFEINCLACHNADRRQDPSGAALQAARQNYRWVATVGAGLAVVKGVSLTLDDFYDPEFEYKIETQYDKSLFNADNKVFLDIVRKPPDNRCYFCHSVQDMGISGKEEWTRHEDIHLTAGMTCTDCHRNGVDHMISRGEEHPDPSDHEKVAALSCRGCHLGTGAEGDDDAQRQGGQLGAPHPKHAGIPAVHFEVLSCTACHSGPYPKAIVGGSSPFSVGDIEDLQAFVTKLMRRQNDEDPVSMFLYDELSDSTRDQLEDFDDSTSDKVEMQRSLIEDINSIIQGLSIYETKRFKGVTLRPITKQLLDKSQPGEVLVHLNRLLLEDAYPMELSRYPVGIVRTARVHQLGLHGKHALVRRLPHIMSPVFKPGEDGKIAPHRMFWPAYWGIFKNNKVKAISPAYIKEIASDALGVDDQENQEKINDWRPFTTEQIAEVIPLIKEDFEAMDDPRQNDEIVYLSAGKLYRLVDGEVVPEEHEAAEAYAWPIGHDVRPASQSLGANGNCRDCHNPQSNFFVGNVGIDSPFSGEVETKPMVDFQELDPAYTWAFSFSFVFRPIMKIVVSVACILLSMILIWYVLRALGCLSESASKTLKNPGKGEPSDV